MISPRIPVFRACVLGLMAAGEIWATIRFWSDLRFTQFFVGSIAIWLIAAFFLFREELAKHQTEFVDFAWVSLAIFAALDARRDHGLWGFLFWIALAGLLVYDLLSNLIYDREIRKRNRAVQIGLEYTTAALIWIWVLGWLRQFLPRSVPLWIEVLLLAPALFFLIRIFMPDSWFQRNKHIGSSIEVSKTSGDPA